MQPDLHLLFRVCNSTEISIFCAFEEDEMIPDVNSVRQVRHANFIKEILLKDTFGKINGFYLNIEIGAII